jgi:hypothetical protein
MPKAGKKHFPYTKAGKKRAQKYAKKHGLKVKGSKNPGYSTEGTIMNKELYKRVGRLFEKDKDPLKTGEDIAVLSAEDKKRKAAAAAKEDNDEYTSSDAKHAKKETAMYKGMGEVASRISAEARAKKKANESVWNTYKGIARIFIEEIAVAKPPKETDPHAEGGPDVPKIAHDDPTASPRPKGMDKAAKLAKKGQRKAQGR